MHWKNCKDAASTSRAWLPAPDSDHHRVDPHLVWAELTEFAYLGGRKKWIPILIELTKGTISAQQFAAGKWDHRPDWNEWIRVPWNYADPAEGLAQSRFCTATVTQDFFGQLQLNPTLRTIIARFELGLPVIATTDTESAPPISVDVQKPATGVVVGVIDDALAFAHARFRDGAGSASTTRIAAYWDQDEPSNSATGFGYGNVLSGPAIDQLMNAATTAVSVDEDDVYRQAGQGYTTPGHKGLGRRAAHGTHVMDLACGEDPASANDKPRIVAVQLPSRTTQDTSGASLGVHVLDGLNFILKEADLLANDENSEPWPVVVNLSYGMIDGPHNGQSLLEAAIEDLIAARRTEAPFSVVLPSGNNHLARCHARIALAAGASQDLVWRLLPDDRTPSFMDIWLPLTAPLGGVPKVTISVTSPWGDSTSVPIGENNFFLWQPPGGGVLGLVAYLAPVPGVRGGRVFFALAPTANLRGSSAVAPSGNWRIGVTNAGPAFDGGNAWIQRDDTPFGYPVFGRQSYFEDPDYERFGDDGRDIEADNTKSYVRRDNSINAIATGTEAIAIGGFCRKDCQPAKYSAGGLTVGTRVGPDAMAVSDDSRVYHGVLATGTRSGSIVAMNGTSVAAPQIARWIADQMNPKSPKPSNAKAVQDLADAREATGLPLPKPLPKRGGKGRIEFDPVVKLPRFDPP